MTNNMKEVISTKAAPAAIGPYSQAIKVGNLVYTSGQIPIDPATGNFVEGGIKEQTRQSLSNVKAILEEAGLTMANVVKTTVFMADMNDFADMNAVYAEFFAEPYPARSAVAVKTLPKGALVEIEVYDAEAVLPSFHPIHQFRRHDMNSRESQPLATCHIEIVIRSLHLSSLDIGPSHKSHVIIEKQVSACLP